MGWLPSEKYSDWVHKFPRLLDYGARGRLNVRSVKLFADGMRFLTLAHIYASPLMHKLGALGSWGAALLEPYSDKPEVDGIMRFGTAELADLMKALWRDEWQVVGDSSHPSPVFID